MRVLYPGGIIIWNCLFCFFVEGGKPENSEKNPWSKARTNNDLNPHKTLGQNRPGPHWWEASDHPRRWSYGKEPVLVIRFPTRVCFLSINKETRYFSFQNTIMTQGTGALKANTTFPEGSLGLMHKRPSYRPTGTHPSPRSVLVWRSANRLTSLSSISKATLCPHWSLTGNTAPPFSAATCGRSWLYLRPP